MQRTLAAQLADQSGLEVISFQHCDCLLFERGEVLKMFLPRSKRVMLGSPKDRIVIGDLLLKFENSLERLRPPSQRFRFSNFITGLPIANFPEIIPTSFISDGVVDRAFFDQIRCLLNVFPNSRSGWKEQFGEEFFSQSNIDRCVKAVEYLRGETQHRNVQL